ncbi:MAG: DUF2304 domain-containing protein [Lachnospiraceae bacterium]|nr:DUF2304 domain-containing protein [Lachnospiraceae bacterium]
MIPHTLQVTLSIAVICYFIIILYYLKRKMLELKYTLVWLVVGLIMGIMIYFPELLVHFVRILGIESNMNGLYILCIAFIIMILMTLTSIASRQQMKIRILIQELSMMEKRVRELESRYSSVDELTDTEKDGYGKDCD